MDGFPSFESLLFFSGFFSDENMLVSGRAPQTQNYPYWWYCNNNGFPRGSMETGGMFER